jgi:hypothetical protein
VATSKRVTTHAIYERNLLRHVVPHIGGAQLQKIDASRVDRLYQDPLAGDPATQRKPLSPNTVRLIASIVSGSFTYAERKGLV